MKRKVLGVVAVLAVIVAFGSVGAFAHECNDPEQTDCHPTPVVPDWRAGNYVPLFDIDRNGSNVGHDSDGDGDIDGDDARYDAQRWRDECKQEAQVEDNQFCVWLDFGNSLFNDGEFDPLNAEPNEVHAGTGGSHCFLFEFAHNCEDHYPGGEGTHDAHGGAIYVDVCGPTPNPDSKYCDDGLRDTQAGLTVLDHNPCGAPV
ncbi:MAG: hypothetical protein ACRDJM_04225, partial [Actinomycetota bacterium]